MSASGLNFRSAAVIYLFASAVLVLALAFGLARGAVHAQKDAVCEGVVLTGGECNGPGSGEGTINNLIETGINIFSAVIGLIAVIMILYGGFKYVTAAGDASKTSSAQQTIIYAIVGLIVVGLAQAFVQFVLGRATGNP